MSVVSIVWKQPLRVRLVPGFLALGLKALHYIANSNLALLASRYNTTTTNNNNSNNVNDKHGNHMYMYGNMRQYAYIVVV